MVSLVENTAIEIDQDIGRARPRPAPDEHTTFSPTPDEMTESRLLRRDFSSEGDGMLGVTSPREDGAWLGSSREASRRLAELIPEEEYRELLSRHSTLVDKSFKEGLTRSELLDLQLVRWNLDRIEDAKYGAGLDFMERMVVTQEYMADKISATLTQLERISMQRKPTRRR